MKYPAEGRSVDEGYFDENMGVVWSLQGKTAPFKKLKYEYVLLGIYILNLLYIISFVSFPSFPKSRLVFSNTTPNASLFSYIHSPMTPVLIEQAMAYLAAIFLRAATVYEYKTSLNANKNAAVMTLCVTLGPIPVTISLDLFHVSDSSLTSIKSGISLLANNPPESSQHILPRSIAASNMHPRLDGDIWICDASCKQLAHRTEVKCILRRDPPLLLQKLLHLLEKGVLQNRIDNQHQCRHDAREQAGRALITDERKERAKRRRRLDGLCSRQNLLLGIVLARRHARVDDPDGVCDKHRRAAGKRACEHRLDGGELHRRAASFERGFFEPRAGPFVP
jgi:hypothetical protein